MEELIYSKIKKYDPKLKDFEISYSNHPLVVDELISLYRMRNKMADNEEIRNLTLQILTDLISIKNKSFQYIKFVTVREDGISRLFFFNEDYSTIFSDFIFPSNQKL